MRKAAHFAINDPMMRPLLRWLQGICASVLVALAIMPTGWVDSGPNLCLSRRLWGVECFGCGMTRGISHLLHGDWHIALAYNRGSVAIMITLLSVALSALILPRTRN